MREQEGKKHCDEEATREKHVESRVWHFLSSRVFFCAFLLRMWCIKASIDQGWNEKTKIHRDNPCVRSNTTDAILNNVDHPLS